MSPQQAMVARKDPGTREQAFTLSADLRYRLLPVYTGLTGNQRQRVDVNLGAVYDVEAGI